MRYLLLTVPLTLLATSALAEGSVCDQGQPGRQGAWPTTCVPWPDAGGCGGGGAGGISLPDGGVGIIVVGGAVNTTCTPWPDGGGCGGGGSVVAYAANLADGGPPAAMNLVWDAANSMWVPAAGDSLGRVRVSPAGRLPVLPICTLTMAANTGQPCWGLVPSTAYEFSPSVDCNWVVGYAPDGGSSAISTSFPLWARAVRREITPAALYPDAGVPAYVTPDGGVVMSVICSAAGTFFAAPEQQ
jgi:hypothetical protein